MSPHEPVARIEASTWTTPTCLANRFANRRRATKNDEDIANWRWVEESGPNGGINRKDWRTVSISDVKADANEVKTVLCPMLRADRTPTNRDAASWAETLVADCRERLSLVLPLNEQDLEFLRRLNDEGAIVPELLTTDPAVQATIREHPGLQ